MKKTLFILLALIFATMQKANATAQYPERILIDSTWLSLYDTPLEQHKHIDDFRSKYPCTKSCTALWRDYIGFWRLTDDCLYLDSIEIPNDTIITVKAVDEPLFKSHKTGSGILADWVSGDIRVVSGKIVRYEHMGFLSVFENEDIYTLKNGKVMAHRHFDNKRVTNVNTELAILELEQHILNLHPEYRGTVGGTAEASDINAEGNLKKVKITIKTHPKGISKKSLTALIEEYMLKHPPFDVVYVRGEYESSKVFFRFDFDEKYRERRLKRLHTLQTLDKEHRETNDTED